MALITENPVAGEQNRVPSIGFTFLLSEPAVLTTKSMGSDGIVMCWKLWMWPQMYMSTLCLRRIGRTSRRISSCSTMSFFVSAYNVSSTNDNTSNNCYEHQRQNYLEKVCKHLRHLFPKFVSYNRFVKLEKGVAVPLSRFIKKVWRLLMYRHKLRWYCPPRPCTWALSDGRFSEVRTSWKPVPPSRPPCP